MMNRITGINRMIFNLGIFMVNNVITDRYLRSIPQKNRLAGYNKLRKCIRPL
jgi:hypothetical protein